VDIATWVCPVVCVYNLRLLSTGPGSKFDRFGVTQQGDKLRSNPASDPVRLRHYFCITAMAQATAGK